MDMDLGKLLKRVYKIQGYTPDPHEREMKDAIDSLLCKTLEEIDEKYEPGALDWMKRNRLKEWRRMKALEKTINDTALQRNVKALKGVLVKYKGLMLSMIGVFSSTEQKQRGI